MNALEVTPMESPRPPQALPAAEYPEIVHLDRANVILRIRLALQTRSGKQWSVKGDKGTAYGWIRISSPPRRLLPGFGGIMSEEDRVELTQLLGLEDLVHQQGHQVPDSYDFYREHIDRAEGRVPRVRGHAYWD